MKSKIILEAVKILIDRPVKTPILFSHGSFVSPVCTHENEKLFADFRVQAFSITYTNLNNAHTSWLKRLRQFDEAKQKKILLPYCS